MCGIAGYAGYDRDEGALRRMVACLAHRGPDDEGVYLDGEVGIGVRRLSIIDVPGGHQPILNESGSLVVVFNGEIYNFRALTEELVRRGHTFRTRTDTEAILHLYEEYGADCVERLRGMFAFAIYDRHRRELFVARDRLGIKPLYYSFRNGKLLFASEAKAILEHPTATREPDLPSIDAFLRMRYVPGPASMFAGIEKLPAAHRLTWKHGEVRIERYWNVPTTRGARLADREYEAEFARLFAEAVRIRLISDVPLGAYLSGGVDSTAVVATMRALTGQPVRTFAVGFNWPGDELARAREVARRLECDHDEVICGPEDFSLLPKIVWHLDEPVGDAIILPMFLLSRLARKKVTVVLTGEGADETLAGYLPHRAMMWSRRYARWTPGLLDGLLVRPLVRCAPLAVINRVASYPGRLGDRGRKKLLDYIAIARAGPPRDEYEFLISLFDDRDLAGLYIQEGLRRRALPEAAGPSARRSYLDVVLDLQYRDWLPDDILMKQDKMSMANSIEARVPFLDHVLVEFLSRVPSHLKMRGIKGKVLLRRYLAGMQELEASRRPKVPFYIPVERYLGQRPLKEFEEACLSEESVRRRGYFAWERVRTLRRMAGRDDFLYGKQVFAMIVLELWHRIFIDREPGWV